jgi:hypothetical protein
MIRKEVTENKLFSEVARPERFGIPTLRFESGKKTLWLQIYLVGLTPKNIKILIESGNLPFRFDVIHETDRYSALP